MKRALLFIFVSVSLGSCSAMIYGQEAAKKPVTKQSATDAATRLESLETRVRRLETLLEESQLGNVRSDNNLDPFFERQFGEKPVEPIETLSSEGQSSFEIAWSATNEHHEQLQLAPDGTKVSFFAFMITPRIRGVLGGNFPQRVYDEINTLVLKESKRLYEKNISLPQWKMIKEVNRKNHTFIVGARSKAGVANWYAVNFHHHQSGTGERLRFSAWYHVGVYKGWSHGWEKYFGRFHREVEDFNFEIYAADMNDEFGVRFNVRIQEPR